MPIRVPKPPLQHGSANGSGDNRSHEPPQPPQLPVQPPVIIGGVLVFGIMLGIGLLISSGRSQAAPDAVHAPAVQAPTAPTPINTPVPTTTAGAQSISMVEQLHRQGLYAAAASMAEKALKTVQLSQAERTRLQELALTAQLYALAAQEPAYLDVPVQQQQVKRYTYLREKAHAAGIPFLSSLEVAQQLAKANNHWRWAKFAYEEAFREGAWSQADELIMRQYEEVLYRQGWWLAQDSATRDEGLRILATRYTFDKAHGRAKDHAWAELRKYCGSNEANWPKPIETPILAAIQGGSQ